MSWGWRKILQVQQVVKPFIWYKLGDGSEASAWFDNWCTLSHLSDFISNRDIYGVGFRLSAKVKDIINNDSWSWPNEWFSKYHNLTNITIPQLSNANDGLVWRDSSNVDSGFSMATVIQIVLWIVDSRCSKHILGES
nr:reverse transcriptase domain, reverse transcriptase zinc-binding domain protein [Tanacetum cinerariifolium]